MTTGLECTAACSKTHTFKDGCWYFTHDNDEAKIEGKMIKLANFHTSVCPDCGEDVIWALPDDEELAETGAVDVIALCDCGRTFRAKVVQSLEIAARHG